MSTKHLIDFQRKEVYVFPKSCTLCVWNIHMADSMQHTYCNQRGKISSFCDRDAIGWNDRHKLSSDGWLTLFRHRAKWFHMCQPSRITKSSGLCVRIAMRKSFVFARKKSFVKSSWCPILLAMSGGTCPRVQLLRTLHTKLRKPLAKLRWHVFPSEILQIVKRG